MQSIESIIANAERPKTFRKRRVNANVAYSYLFDRFQTHNFLDWHYEKMLYDLATWDYEKHPVNVKEEVNLTKAVPPYSERFDEFLGYWLSWGTPINVPFTLEGFFPNPDEIDCSYLEDVLNELEQIGGTCNEVHIAVKGSGIGIGPGICEYYARNIARAQKWVQDAKERLAVGKALHFPKPQARATYSAKSPASLSSFFRGGFTVEEFDRLLIALGIMEQPRRLTEDSKPRTWVSVLRALLDAKVLIPSSNIALHESLIHEYGNQDSLPKLRTLQNGYNSNNAQARDFYDRAIALLKAK